MRKGPTKEPLITTLCRYLKCFYLWDSRGGTRTPDPVINSHLLYQLSYSGKRNNCDG